MGCEATEPKVEYEIPVQLQKCEIVGYSCQTHLAWTLYEQHYDDKDHCYLWFSTEVNPQTVGPSSRPLRIYQDLDEAVKVRDPNELKIRDLRIRLQRVVDRRVGNVQDQFELKKRIASASVKWFRPLLLKLDLRDENLAYCRSEAIDGGATPGEEKNEYLHPKFPKVKAKVIIE